MAHRHDLVDYLQSAIPTDHARQCTAEELLRELSPAGCILDLGCGDGRAITLIEGVGASYAGVDIADSPEVRSRTRRDERFQTFDGRHLPYPDATFDGVYCKQVLEHVRHPEALLAEVSRVLKPDGVFVGSVSFLEPYHSKSIFNWSPYGIYVVFGDAGLTVEQLRPGCDGATLTLRTTTGRRRLFNRWYTRTSPLNWLLDLRAGRHHWDAQTVNALKLSVSGQIVFVARASKQHRFSANGVPC